VSPNPRSSRSRSSAACCGRSGTALRGTDRQLLLMVEPAGEWQRLERSLTSGLAEGVVLLSLHADDPLPRRLVERGVPVVVSGRPPDGTVRSRPSMPTTSAEVGRRPRTCWGRGGPASPWSRGPTTCRSPSTVSPATARLPRGRGWAARPDPRSAGDFTPVAGESGDGRAARERSRPRRHRGAVRPRRARGRSARWRPPAARSPTTSRSPGSTTPSSPRPPRRRSPRSASPSSGSAARWSGCSSPSSPGTRGGRAGRPPDGADPPRLELSSTIAASGAGQHHRRTCRRPCTVTSWTEDGSEEVAVSRRMTIEELAAASGMTVRNVREHQTRGLVPPPALVGRKGYYDDRHLARLQLIRQLQDEGLNLQAVGWLLEQVPPEATDEVARLKQALFAPWVTEAPRVYTVDELVVRFGPDGPRPGSAPSSSGCSATSATAGGSRRPRGCSKPARSSSSSGWRWTGPSTSSSSCSRACPRSRAPSSSCSSPRSSLHPVGRPPGRRRGADRRDPRRGRTPAAGRVGGRARRVPAADGRARVTDVRPDRSRSAGPRPTVTRPAADRVRTFHRTERSVVAIGTPRSPVPAPASMDEGGMCRLGMFHRTMERE
jgi:DNA-binding transcriptional MerR regulator